MFDGSDEYVLREILGNVDHIYDLHLDLAQNFLELQYSNDLKEFELGIINQDELYKRKDEHYASIREIYDKRNNR